MAFERVFLLSLKPALISLNICASSLAFIGSSSCSFKLITALPTFGLGIKQFAGTFAARYGFV